MKENSHPKNSKKQILVTPVMIIDEDTEKKKNFQLVGKVFGNMAQSISLPDKNFIKNNASNNFPGGFKQPSILKSNKNSLQQNNSKTTIMKNDVFTVYDQFGLINDSIRKRNSQSKGQSKYREELLNYESNSNPFRLEQPAVLNQMRNNRRKQFQQVMQNEYVNLHEYYDLAKQKDRQQTVIHVKSSLDTMTIQNVEAKLQVHRLELKNIEKQYNAKKSIKKSNQEQYLGDMDYSHKKSFTKTGENDPYQQYGKTQSQIYEMIKKNQKDDQNQIIIDQMWEQKLRKNPKLLQYSKKYQEYLVQKDAKNILYGTVRQNLFKWDKYKQPAVFNNKSSPKLIQKSHSKSKSISKLNRSLQKIEHKESQQQYKLQSKSISDALATKDDKFISKYIFAQVDIDKRGLLSKEELLDYIIKNQYIIKSYSIDQKWIYTDLDNFETKRKGMLNKEQLGLFLATFQHVQHPQIKLTDLSLQMDRKQFERVDKAPVSKSPFQINFSKDMYRFRNLFQKLDLNDDKILKRQELIQNIFIDPDCSKILDKVAIKIKIIDKNIIYRQIISFILDDFKRQKNQQIKKSKEYITFDRFCQYFEFPETINLKKLNNKKNKHIQTYITNQIEIFDIEQENLVILKDLFDAIPRVYQDFIVTSDFIQKALLDPQVLSFQEDLSRIQSVQTSIPIETVRLTLQRMAKQSDQCIDWQNAKSFFSRRGRPLDWDEALIIQKKALRQQNRIKSINLNLKRSLISNKQLEISAKIKSQYENHKKKTPDNNFTVPQPFNITDEIKLKQNKKNLEIDQTELKKLAKQRDQIQRFKAKPVNKDIFGRKPDLIQGKRPASSSKQLPSYYKYENYENDRIERALKKAQQQYDLVEKEKEIKQMAQIKANKIGVDLTKNLFQIMKEQKKKAKEKKDPKRPLTEFEQCINERLHPTIKNDEQKIKKLEQKQKKLEEVEKVEKQKKKIENLAKQSLIKKTREEAEVAKKQKQAKEKKFNEAGAKANETFKPKLNPKKKLSQKQKQMLEEFKKNRTEKQQQEIRKMIEKREADRKRILQRQLKDPYVKLQDLGSNEQIIEKIYSINIFDILIDSSQREEFNTDHEFKVKDKKERQIYLKGQVNKFKIAMEKEDKILRDLRIKQKEQLQQNKIMLKEKSTISKGQSDKMKADLIFHGSKSLQRYRKLQQGCSPSQVPSEFDRYKDDDFDDIKYQKKKTAKIIKEEDIELSKVQQKHEN